MSTLVQIYASFRKSGLFYEMPILPLGSMGKIYNFDDIKNVHLSAENRHDQMIPGQNT